MSRSHVHNKADAFSAVGGLSGSAGAGATGSGSVKPGMKKSARRPFASALQGSFDGSLASVLLRLDKAGKSLAAWGETPRARELLANWEKMRGGVLAGAYVLLYALAILLISLTAHHPELAKPTWGLFIPLVGMVCAFAGWRQFAGPTIQTRATYILRQVLHWGALLMVINVLFLEEVQLFLNAEIDSFVIIYLVGLTSMLAGIYLDWKMGLFGLFLVFSGVILAFIDDNAMLIVLSGVAFMAITITALVWVRYNRNLERRMIEAQGRFPRGGF
jgi:hypothetical protein